ncbi:SAC3 GANP domain containing protein [Trichuris trichiura]|uniref:SAC3 GANP domain containing protein n=1 Tax=Trichuris trichiura TaxID=36087 RepID=A0A077Z2N5_TRITR|nr:SAC3 GANP domain containing protein [Trichuris trichiura]
MRLDAAEPLVGLCQSMCPEKERYERQLRHRFSFYESLAACEEGNDGDKADPSLMVKEFVRSAAGSADSLPYEIRSMEALNKTMEHMLLHVIAKEPTEDSLLSSWYDFIASRIKMIRREIMQQMILCQDAVKILEMCVRFFIYASYRLSILPEGVFSEALNAENIRLCLLALEELTENGADSSNRPEFASYAILLDLDSIHILSMLRKHRSSMVSPELRFAANLWISFHTCDYVQYFRSIKKKATFLQACLANYHVLTMRTRVLMALKKAYGRYIHQIPVETLSTWLGFEDINAASCFCDQFGVPGERSNVKTVCPPPRAKLPPSFREVLVRSKRGDTPVEKAR